MVLIFPDSGTVIPHLHSTIPLIRAVVIPVAVFIVFNFLLNLAKKTLLKKARTKKQITNIELFQKMAKYMLVLMLIIVATFSYIGSWAGIGISVGFLSVIVAWTLMRPLLGVVAWLTLVIKRPISIGDRIKVGEIKGDVEDITITHLYVREAGALVHGSEDISGSLAIIPNAVLFEQSITNYTDKDNYVLDEVSFTMTYESDIDKASKIGIDIAMKVLRKQIPGYVSKPYIRTYMHEEGVGIHVRFFAPAKELGQYTSDITYELLKEIKKTKKIKLCKSGIISANE